MSGLIALKAMLALMAGALAMPSVLVAQEATETAGASGCTDDSLQGDGGACSLSDALPGPFIVFFPWGEMGVDADGSLIVDDAAAAYVDGLAITLSGHSDRSGPAAVNRRISERRAQAVRRALIQRGVPADAIRIEVQGEEALLIGTSDGVREAQNRRVEILFSSID